MKLEEIKKEVKRLLKGSKGSHDWDHTQRVYNLCIQIGKKEKANLPILKLAAILHDVSRPIEDESSGQVCHAKEGTKIAKKILEKHGIEDKKIQAILHCIKTHRFRGKVQPKTLEAKILFDADKLDSIGAVGLGRAFLFAGEVGARLHNKNIDIEKTKPYTKEDTAYREFLLKLRKVKDRMFTREGKGIARQRHRFMVDFFKRLDKEIKGEL